LFRFTSIEAITDNEEEARREEEEKMQKLKDLIGERYVCSTSR